MAKFEDQLPFTLARLRKTRGVSQTVLARRIGVGPSTLSGLESGRDPRVSSLAAYVHHLGGEMVHVAVFKEPDGTISKMLLQLPGDYRRSPGTDFFAKRHATTKAQRTTARPMLAAVMKLRERAE